MPVIGFLDPRAPDALTDRLCGFRQGLKDTGYVEGENVTVEYRWAENRLDRLPELVADLVRRRVAVMAAPGVSLWRSASGFASFAASRNHNSGLIRSLPRAGPAKLSPV